MKESAAGEAPAGKEIPKEAAAPEEAPASPEEDPQYQVVVEEMEIKAKHQKTPAKKPEQKQAETVLAAKAATKVTYKHTDKARENHLSKIALVPPDDLTVAAVHGRIRQSQSQSWPPLFTTKQLRKEAKKRAV